MPAPLSRRLRTVAVIASVLAVTVVAAASSGRRFNRMSLPSATSAAEAPAAQGHNFAAQESWAPGSRINLLYSNGDDVPPADVTMTNRRAAQALSSDNTGEDHAPYIVEFSSPDQLKAYLKRQHQTHNALQPQGSGGEASHHRGRYYHGVQLLGPQHLLVHSPLGHLRAYHAAAVAEGGSEPLTGVWHTDAMFKLSAPLQCVVSNMLPRHAAATDVAPAAMDHCGPVGTTVDWLRRHLGSSSGNSTPAVTRTATLKVVVASPSDAAARAFVKDTQAMLSTPRWVSSRDAIAVQVLHHSDHRRWTSAATTTPMVRSPMKSTLYISLAPSTGPLLEDDARLREAGRWIATLLSSVGSMRTVTHLHVAPTFLVQNSVATHTLQSESATGYDTPSGTQLWRLGLDGTNQIISVGDTGLDYDSCYFRDPGQPRVALYPDLNFNHRKILSYVECVTDDGRREVGDGNSAHGTHVCGSATGAVVQGTLPNGQSMGSSGIPHYNGMAQGAKLFFHDLTCGPTQDLVLPPDLYDFFIPSYAVGSRVQSNSWGNDHQPTDYNAIDRETDLFFQLHQDMLSIFAAGNNPSAGVLSPAASKNVLTVGAHLSGYDLNTRNQMASFSAPGPLFDGRIKPEIAGPGQVIVSSRSDGNLNSNNCDTEPKSGTSMATPLISGSATILRQYITEGGRTLQSSGATPISLFDPAMIGKPSAGTPATVFAPITPDGPTMKALMLTGAASMWGAVPNMHQGWGRLQLGELLLKGDYIALHVIQNQTVGDRERFDACVRLPGTNGQPDPGLKSKFSQPTTITLVWFDSALPAAGSHVALCNDLDLVVTTETGSVRGVNGKPNRSPTNLATDTANVVEQAVYQPSVDALNSGTMLRLTVYGANIIDAGSDGRGQRFSVVVKAPIGSSIVQCPTGPAGASTPGIKCPGDCSGHGDCDGYGVCTCKSQFYYPDCSLCDARDYCHGNGACTSTADGITCQCRGSNFDMKASGRCDVCVSGKFGPACDNDCICSHHGACDSSGTCQCFHNTTDGFWATSDCHRCATDYTRTLPNILKLAQMQQSFAAPASFPPIEQQHECSLKSIWCKKRVIREATILGDAVGLNNWVILQINDDHVYEDSLYCGYRVTAVNPDWTLRVYVDWTDIENPYDTLKIYEGSKEVSSALKQSLTGASTPSTALENAILFGGKPGTTVYKDTALLQSSGPQLTFVFQSDIIGPKAGFRLLVEGVPTACRSGATTCHGKGECAPGGGNACVCQGNYDPAYFCSRCRSGWMGAACDVVNTGTSTTAPGEESSGTDAPTRHPTAPTTTAAPLLATGVCDTINNDAAGGAVLTECSNHGTCNADRSACTCKRHYVGDSCETECPFMAVNGWTDDCSGHGKCVASVDDDAATTDGTLTGSCKCDEPMAGGSRVYFFGRACQLRSSDVYLLDAAVQPTMMQQIANGATSGWWAWARFFSDRFAWRSRYLSPPPSASSSSGTLTVIHETRNRVTVCGMVAFPAARYQSGLTGGSNTKLLPTPRLKLAVWERLRDAGDEAAALVQAYSSPYVSNATGVEPTKTIALTDVATAVVCAEVLGWTNETTVGVLMDPPVSPTYAVYSPVSATNDPASRSFQGKADGDITITAQSLDPSTFTPVVFVAVIKDEEVSMHTAATETEQVALAFPQATARQVAAPTDAVLLSTPSLMFPIVTQSTTASMTGAEAAKSRFVWAAVFGGATVGFVCVMVALAVMHVVRGRKRGGRAAPIPSNDGPIDVIDITEDDNAPIELVSRSQRDPAAAAKNGHAVDVYATAARAEEGTEEPSAADPPRPSPAEVIAAAIAARAHSEAAAAPAPQANAVPVVLPPSPEPMKDP